MLGGICLLTSERFMSAHAWLSELGGAGCRLRWEATVTQEVVTASTQAATRHLLIRRQSSGRRPPGVGSPNPQGAFVNTPPRECAATSERSLQFLAVLPGLFSPGDPIVLRDLWGGRVWSARPMTVVKDEPDETELFVWSSLFMKAAAGGRTSKFLRLPAEPWELREQARSRHLGVEGRRRTGRGAAARIALPRRRRVDPGGGRTALVRLEERRPPFDRDWSGWHPDPSWVSPSSRTMRPSSR
jgi:hypothetical protein